MGSVAKQNPKQSPKAQSVFNQGFSFAIKEVKYLIGGDGSPVQLVLVKSPFPNLIYNGEWSFTSSNWTSDIKREVGITQMKSQDGYFWMSLQELKSKFNTLCCCKCNENYRYKWVNLGASNRIETLVQFVIRESTHLFITVHQQDNRLSDSSVVLAQDRYDSVWLWLAKSSIQPNSSVEFVTGQFS